MLEALLWAVGIGLVVALVVVGGMIRQLKTAVPKREANDYIKQGSLHLSVRRDNFLYRKVEKKRREPRQ